MSLIGETEHMGGHIPADRTELEIRCKSENQQTCMCTSKNREELRTHTIHSSMMDFVEDFPNSTEVDRPGAKEGRAFPRRASPA